MTVHDTQQTEVAKHSSPVPTPISVMGEQIRPTRGSTPSTTTPSKPSSLEGTGSLAYVVSVVKCTSVATRDRLSITF